MTATERADRELAWADHLTGLERHTFLVGIGLVVVFIPLWSVVDFLVEPTHSTSFAMIRLAVSAAAVAAFVFVWRSRHAAAKRAALFTVGLCTGIGIAWMISRVDGHDSYAVYTLGLSLVFWGYGLLVLWPASLTASLFVLILAANLGFQRTGSGEGGAPVFFGFQAYLATAAAISTAVSRERRKMAQGSFFAAHERALRNVELARALATLHDTRERFVAAEKLSALGRLVAQLSHEINNPMNVIKNNLKPLASYLTQLERMLDAIHLLGDRSDAEVDALWKEHDIDFVRTDMREAIVTVATAAERIAMIHKELRAFMRGDTVQAISGDLNETVRTTVAILWRTPPAGVSLEEDYGVLPPAEFHASQISQVVMNLLQNAIDAVGDSGKISVGTRADAQGIVLHVSDSGPGLSEAARAHLFEPFFTTKDIGKGTGLGMAVCYQILKAHAGSITLDDSYQAGARFLIRIPLVAPEVASA